MRPRRLATGLICVISAVSWGCKDEVPPGASEGQTAAGRTVTLTGCVGAGEAPDEYRLRFVRLDTGHSPTPHLPQAPPVPGITEGAWVRLDGRDSELRDLMGQRVRVTGQVIDTGENTIGTAGAYGYETPSGDKSQAASDEHYAEKQQREAGRIARQSLANGRAAEIQVTQLADIGEPCEGLPPVEGRR